MTHAPSTLRTLRHGLHVLETRVDDFDVRAVLVEGRERVLVWDTLAHPDQMGGVDAFAAGRPVVVAYSHADWDHVYGTAALGAVASVVGHRVCAQRFSGEVQAELAERRAAEPGRWSAVRVVPPTRTFGDADALGLGGVTVHLHHLPGHTADCAVAWIPAWGALLAGDTVETPLPVVNDGASVRPWLAGLGRWASEPGVELVVPSHGRIGGGDVIRETSAYLEGLLEGKTEAPTGAASPFYARTHQDNVQAVASARRVRPAP